MATSSAPFGGHLAPRQPVEEVRHPPSVGKKRGEGNGVVPIKAAFLSRSPRTAGRPTTVKTRGASTPSSGGAEGGYFGLEWETGIYPPATAP